MIHVDATHIALAVLSKKFVLVSSLVLGVAAMTLDPMIFAAASVIVIGAIAAAAVTVINALGAVKKDTISLLAKQGEISNKTDVIAGHVDGMTTAVAAKRTADDETIMSLRQQLSDCNQRAALLAQAKTSADVAAALRNLKD